MHGFFYAKIYICFLYIEVFVFICNTMLIPPLFPWLDTIDYPFDHKGFSNVIIDRGSKYTVSGGRVTSKEFMKEWFKIHLADKYFKKATHNTYAYRIMTEHGAIIEWKNDDWETGAGQCILRELQRKNVVNIVVVVTRYFWWTQLHADRFRHVVDATKIFLERSGVEKV